MRLSTALDFEQRVPETYNGKKVGGKLWYRPVQSVRGLRRGAIVCSVMVSSESRKSVRRETLFVHGDEFRTKLLK